MNSKHISTDDLTIDKAREWANKILDSEYRGRGDTLQAVMYRIQIRHGISTTLIDRLTSQSREVNDMLLSNFALVATAYRKVCDE